MGDISIIVKGLGPGNNHLVLANCVAALDSGETGQVIYFQCTWAYGASVATINTAIKDAAIAEALAQAGYTVGALDNKQLLGGAVTV